MAATSQKSYTNLNVSVFKAVVENNVVEVENLISLGADVNTTEVSRQTLLHNAAFYSEGNSHYQTIKVLLINGADVNSQTAVSNSTPLHYLVRRADVKTVQLLLDFGADVNLKDSYGEISLFKLFNGDKSKDKSDIVKLLVEYGSDVNNTVNLNPRYFTKLASKVTLKLTSV